jgi:hypothetical protein
VKQRICSKLEPGKDAIAAGAEFMVQVTHFFCYFNPDSKGTDEYSEYGMFLMQQEGGGGGIMLALAVRVQTPR